MRVKKGFTIAVKVNKLTFYLDIYVTAMSTVLYNKYIFY